jgi:hypothetical protein
MRKVLALAAALAVMAILVPGAAHPETVGACGWYWESSRFNNVWVYDYSVGGWTTIDYELDTYNDGCGSRFYVSTVWTGDGTPMWLQSSERAWVCGGYAGSRSRAAYTNWIQVSSPSYFYGICGRQADNYPSSSWSGVTSPASTSAYLTA